MARGPSKTRLPSGYGEDFVNAVEDDFQCSICHLPLKEPVLTRCGHRFCKECLDGHFRSKKDNGQCLNCPTDRRYLDQDRDVFPDKATERRILSFGIKCPSKGCDWTGKLRNKKDHLATCSCNIVRCSNKNCDFTVQRKNLQDHMKTACQWRIIECEHCSEPHPKCQMEDHLATCSCKIVRCSNKNCDFTVQRKNLQDHMKTACQWRIIECEHCSEPHPKCQMEDHIGRCLKFPLPCPNSCGVSIPREKIQDHATNDCPLTLIPCPYDQIGCKRKVQRREVESHLESDVKPHLDLACVKLETRVFIWKIENFSEVLRQAKAKEKMAIDSSPFYTDRTESYGYKLKINIRPNSLGSAKDTYLSVYIVVMKGEYDAILPWPFKKKVQFSLIDQQEDPAQRENVTKHFMPVKNSESFRRPKNKENIGLGFLEFVSHKKLYSRRYIVEDTLFLQVEISPALS